MQTGGLQGGTSMIIREAECRAYAVEYARRAKAGDISIERATALMSIAHSWEMLADDMARYEATVRAESPQVSQPTSPRLPIR
jgi:hypothetical protein